MAELVVLLQGHPIGVVEQDRRGRLSLTYEPEWREAAEAIPLSLSMPLSRAIHGDDRIRPFLEGLLPDNGELLKKWARLFGVSAQNPFSLLKHVGEDCAGAVQLVEHERVGALDEGVVEPMTDGEVADLLRGLVEGVGTGRLNHRQGQFSLAGAQPKTALYRDGDGWGVPGGRIPTTHILKPPGLDRFHPFEINEHFCLNLARALSIPAAHSEVATFEDQSAIIVARYDREWTDRGLVRLHQEDLCQALAVSPLNKYEAEGGPGAPDIVSLLMEASDDPGLDVGTFMDALVFNWAIAGPDAHAKNYSLMLGPGSVRLAPLYDILSLLPYDREVSHREVRMAMRIHTEYHVWRVQRRDWERLAEACELDAEPVVRRAGELLTAMPEACGRVVDLLVGEGLPEGDVVELAELVSDHSRVCLARLASD